MNVENKDCWLQENCSKIDCDRFCMRRYKLNYLYERALISLTQRKHRVLLLDSDEIDLKEFIRLKNIEDNIQTFIQEGKNLYLFSSICGNGKTSWALRMIESYFNKIWITSPLTCKALFISVPRYLLAMKANISQKDAYFSYIQENVLNCDIVIWDDIATKSATSFEHEHLLSIIDYRISCGKSNIFTSNLANEYLTECLGDRLASRILNTSIQVELKGKDKRELSLIKSGDN